MEIQLLTDKDLVNLYQKGNNKAFETLLKRYKDKVYKYIYWRTFDLELTKDIFQDTFLKVIVAIQEDKYFESGRFISWVYSIAHNLIVDSFTGIKFVGSIANESTIDLANDLRLSEKSAEDIMSDEQVQKDVLCLIKQLPAPQAEVLQMRFFRNLSFKEIAKISKVGKNTALGRMRYALINLRKIVAENNICLELSPY
ncbi:MAG: sigma-70 family RNA polymerase sigma factor [Paludibacter sp.]|jgi:RNA polymerase sigma-70 factor (ECF subfamily)|nr:sigma-70 family RNA polymerase sigma factor [Paludibacter sp.]